MAILLGGETVTAVKQRSEATGVIYAWQVESATIGTTEKVKVKVNQSVEGAELWLGIYKDHENRPGALLGETKMAGTLPLGESFAEVALSIRLEKGKYWLALVGRVAPIRPLTENTEAGQLTLKSSANTFVGLAETTGWNESKQGPAIWWAEGTSGQTAKEKTEETEEKEAQERVEKGSAAQDTFAKWVKARPGLQAYWRENELTGTEAKDTSAVGESSGTYSTEKGEHGAKEGEFHLGEKAFVRADGGARSVRYVGNGQPGDAAEEAPTNKGYGGFIKLPEQKGLSEAKARLRCIRSEGTVGMFLRLDPEYFKQYTALIGCLEEVTGYSGWSIQLEIGGGIGGGKSRQIMFFAFAQQVGTCSTEAGSKVLKEVKLPGPWSEVNAASENTVGKEGVLCYGNIPGGPIGGGLTEGKRIASVKKEGTPEAANGELELEGTAPAETKSGILLACRTRPALAVSNIQLLPGTSYWLVITLKNGTMKMYLNGSETEWTYGNVAAGSKEESFYGGFPFPKTVTYVETGAHQSGQPPAIAAVGEGGPYPNWADSFLGRKAETMLANVAWTGAEVKEGWEIAQQALLPAFTPATLGMANPTERVGVTNPTQLPGSA